MHYASVYRTLIALYQTMVIKHPFIWHVRTVIHSVQKSFSSTGQIRTYVVSPPSVFLQIQYPILRPRSPWVDTSSLRLYGRTRRLCQSFVGASRGYHYSRCALAQICTTVILFHTYSQTTGYKRNYPLDFAHYSGHGREIAEVFKEHRLRV